MESVTKAVTNICVRISCAGTNGDSDPNDNLSEFECVNSVGAANAR